MAIRAAALIFCDRLHRVTETGNLTLADTFTRVRSSTFPTPEQHIVVYALLVGDPGEEGLLEMTCVEQATNVTLLSAQQNVQLGQEGKRSVAVFFEGFRYARAGDYRFQLTCNRIVVAEHVLPVVEIFE